MKAKGKRESRREETGSSAEEESSPSVSSRCPRIRVLKTILFCESPVLFIAMETDIPLSLWDVLPQMDGNICRAQDECV